MFKHTLPGNLYVQELYLNFNCVCVCVCVCVCSTTLLGLSIEKKENNHVDGIVT